MVNLPELPTFPASGGGEGPEPGWYRMMWIGEFAADGSWTGVRTTVEQIPGPEPADCVARLGALRAKLVEAVVMWRSTARQLRETQRQGNIAAGVAYDLAACDVEEVLTVDGGWVADRG